jgi:C4-dicarboxylate-specific signal transduction histidine kinase
MARMGHKVEESLEIIEKQAFRIANIVRGLLSMARQTNDSASEFLEINSLIINTLNLIRGQIEKRNIEISFNLQEKLPVIRCGSVYFQQILLNFLLHSKKQIGENGFINIETAVDEQDFVVITIKDSGVAVPEEYISKVMDPFSELENSTELNLGLTVSVQMVTDIGGSVQIKSDQKSGNNVTIKLPGLVNKQLKIKKEVV